MSQEYTEEILYSLFDNICQGSSPVYHMGEELFVKHPTASDFAKFEYKKRREIDALVKKGGLTNDQIIQSMKDDGSWDMELEKRIVVLEREIFNSKAFIKTQVIKSRIARERIQNKKRQEEIKEIKEELASNIPYDGVDIIISKKVNTRFIMSSLFVDEKCKKSYFSKKEMLDKVLNDNEFVGLFNAYNKFKDDFSNEILESITVQDFFRTYFMFCDSPYDFFGKPAKDLTQNQISLLYFGKFFKSVFENHSERMPEEIKNDAEAIIDFVDAESYRSRNEQRQESKSDKHGNFVMSTKFGASEQDLRSVSDDKFVDIMDIVPKGGSLNAEGLANAVLKT